MDVDPERLRLYTQILNVVIVIAAIAATSFPILYAFSTWQKSVLGRVLMANAVVTAFLVDVAVIYRFRLFGVEAAFIAYMVGLVLFACTKTAMSVTMWRTNHRKENKDERIRSKA